MSGTVTENKDRNYSNTEMIQTLQKLVRYPSISSEDETSIYGHDTEEAVDYLMGTALSLGLRICKTKEYAYIETGGGCRTKIVWQPLNLPALRRAVLMQAT